MDLVMVKQNIKSGIYNHKILNWKEDLKKALMNDTNYSNKLLTSKIIDRIFIAEEQLNSKEVDLEKRTQTIITLAININDILKMR